VSLILRLSNFKANVSTPFPTFGHSFFPTKFFVVYDARLVDIWACAIVYYCLHFQELPWRVAQLTDPLYAAYANACTSPLHSSSQMTSCPPTIHNLSPRACRSLMRKMLEPDPKKRCLVEEVVGHAWVQGIEVTSSSNLFEDSFFQLGFAAKI
jgi:serine/threonine protein kinase